MNTTIHRGIPRVGSCFQRVFTGCLTVGAVVLTHAAVTVGTPRDKVVESLGPPTGKLLAGGKEILLYPDGLSVELRDGVVSAVKHAPVDSSGATAAAQSRRDTAPPAEKAAADIPAPFVPVSTRTTAVPALRVTWAESPYTVDMVSVSVKRGKDRPPLHLIAGRDALNRTRQALAGGADINAVDGVGRTALHRYAEPSPYPHEAVKQMKLLIENGADVNAKDSLGQTALHLAARHAYAQVKYLIEAGATLDARDNNGQTPLHVATAEHNTGGRDLLIAAGADSAIADANGATVADIAREQARWVPRYKVDGALKSLCFGNNRFIACGSFMKSILVSIDGAHWREVPAPGKSDLAAAAFVGDGFVGWATHRGAYGSRDGVAWETLDVPDSPIHFSHVAIGPDRAIAMGMSATLLQSRDGRVWRSLDEGVCAYTLGVGWLGDRFVAVNRDGMVFCSRDGLTWGKAKLDLKGLALKRARCVNGELFALGYGGLLLRTSNGVDWRQIPVPVRDALNDIAHGRGTYAAVGDKGTVLLSKDAETWRLRRQKGVGDFLSVAFGNNTFVVAGRAGIWSSHP
ncbi:MAG: ankyrin repeat domain-containing protein [Lentisphaeria bacterium]|nr:ankyrin repeat domain-containing protein [Lentisphaeria bacterium]